MSPDCEQIMSARVVHHDDVVVVIFEGEVDLLTGLRFQAVLHQAVREADGRALVIDLSEVRFFGLTGARILAELLELHPAVCVRLVVGGARSVQRLLRLTGLDRLMEVYVNPPRTTSD